jgi:hypothetical protein
MRAVGPKWLKYLVIGITLMASLSATAWALMRESTLRRSMQRYRLTVPTLVDLGTVSSGTMNTASIDIVNSGKSMFTLTDFKASCSCQTVYQKASSSKAGVGTLMVGPHSSNTILVDILVGGDSGSRQGSVVHFQDRQRGEVYSVPVVYTPVASMFAVPKAVPFGELVAGTRTTRTVEIRRSARIDGLAVTVVGATLKSLGARFVAASASQADDFNAANPGQYLVGHLDLTLDATSSNARVRERVVVAKDALTRVEIPISAEILLEHALIPPRVLLPRRTSGGLLSSSRIICQSRSGRAFSVAFDSATAPFHATVEQPRESHPDRAFIDLEYVGAIPKGAPQDYDLTFKIRDSGHEYALACPVRVLAGAP